MTHETVGEVTTLEELATLDSDEIMRGYMHKGLPPDGASRSFIHGWLNAYADAGKVASSGAQRKLAREYVSRMKK